MTTRQPAPPVAPDDFTSSDELYERGRRVDARAYSRGDVLVAEHGRTVYPRYVDRLEGAYVWDVDGHRYIDYNLGYGPVVLGHADPRVTAAVTDALARGNCLAPYWSPAQVELCETLVRLTPGSDMAYLLKTGSDATSAAVRLARIATGRDRIVRWGYNGWHDWACPEAPGIPAAVRDLTLGYEYGNIASLDKQFRRHPREIAAVVMMPFGDERATPGHLADVQAVCREHGALLVLDEMRSGFRMRPGPMAPELGVEPDITTYSKALANGYPISAVVGRANVMEGFARTRISSTFFAGPAEMAAALTTIRILEETDALARIEATGTRLQQGMSDIVRRLGLPAEVVGYPAMPFLRFTDHRPDARARLSEAFHVAATRAGVLLHPAHQWFVSAAHSHDDIEWTLTVIADAAGTALRAVAEPGA